MRYLQFEIEHYKGIKEKATIDLSRVQDSRIFTLVGLNESGKTSLLEAINLLQNDCEEQAAYRMIHVAEKGNFNGEIAISATLELDEEDEQCIKQYCADELEFKLTQEIKRMQVSKIFTFSSSKFVGSRIKWQLSVLGRKKGGKKDKKLHEVDKAGFKQLTDYIESNLPKILFYENFLFEFPEKIYLSGRGAKDSENNLQYMKIVQDILDSFEKGLTIEEHIVKRYNSGTEEDRSALEAVQDDMEVTLTKTIMDSWSDVFPSVGEEVVVEFKNDSDGIYLEMKIKQGGSRYSVSERSLGFQWFFSFLLFTQFRKERKGEFGETLFLLDEPASNLHPKSQRQLLEVFKELSSDCKIIYSTHSQYLINAQNLSSTFIVQNKCADYDGRSQFGKRDTDIRIYPYCQFASCYPDERDHFKPILDAIDYIPSDMELVDNIICLEGKNDYYACNLMARYVDEGKDLRFYPGAGVTKYDLLFRLYLAWGSKFIAVFDGDLAGSKAKKQYENNLSYDIKERIFLLSEINSCWEKYTTEKLFSEQDRLKIIQKYNPEQKEYAKSKFNSALLQLYASMEDFEFSDETLDNFRKLFAFMGAQLERIA